jgi:hypothetical protein
MVVRTDTHTPGDMPTTGPITYTPLCPCCDRWWISIGPLPPPGVDVEAAVRAMLHAVAGRCQAAGGACGGATVNVCRGVITV